MLKGFVAGAVAGTETLKQMALNVADTIFSSKWIGLAGKTLWHHPWLLVWLVVTLWLALAVDKWLDARYSEFWHRDYLRLKLRKALGLG
jgi:energy-converting hydrogenase Eha subunit G